ncbi:MAG: thiamine pyrophosphate-binding protein [Chloroflexota bacterium]|nr:MAG: thiamine pyrophosphate-binding protein [Chloroflexota bacterium]
MKVTDYIAGFLAARGVSHVFELVGGMTTHLLDSLHQRPDIRIVSVHHEQAAAFAAEGWARMTGLPGVAMATSGPGATNLLTGIGSCYFDSTPAVFLTGQVNRSEQKGDRPIRQLGFQETDIVSMARPITKAAWLAQTPAEVPDLLRRAFELATEGRPGPVLLDLPMDVQRASIDIGVDGKSAARPVSGAPIPGLDGLISGLRAAQRPLVLVGGGIHAARARSAFRKFAFALGVPVVHSLMAVDALPFDDLLRVGMIGTYGNRWANLGLREADFLLVVGSRLDIRQTGSDVAAFAEGKRIIHVDCDTGELNNRIANCEGIVAHLADFLPAATARVDSEDLPDWSSWHDHLAAARAQWPDTAEQIGLASINPNEFVHAISRAGRNASAFVVDVGQHQMWAAQSVETVGEQRFVTSGGMGAMGFSLPAAIGVAFARPGASVVLIAGDGGFQLNLQELQTVVRNRLPIKIAILNNGCHGMVRQFQQSYFESRYQSTLWGYSAPDFVRVAEAFGVPARRVSESSGVSDAVGWLMSDRDGPALLDVAIDTYANAYPKIAFGRPISEMEPQATPLEIEST